LCISRTTCTFCDSFKPKLEKLGNEYDIEVFYIDIDKYSDEKYQEFKKYISFDGSTPVTAFIKNGEETTASNRISGNASYEKIVSKFKNNGFIK
jgi:thiol-disulfide isomerase/thioredoxin